MSVGQRNEPHPLRRAVLTSHTAKGVGAAQGGYATLQTTTRSITCGKAGARPLPAFAFPSLDRRS